MDGGMEGRLFCIILVVTAVLAQEHTEESYSRQYIPKRGQAFSYSHVVHDHGTSEAQPGSYDYPHYPVYAIAVGNHVPYAVSVPVAVPVAKPYQNTIPKQYPVTVERPVPVTVNRPYLYPVKFPMAAAVPTLVPVSVPKPYPSLVKEHHDQEEDERSAEYSSAEYDESR